MGWIQNTINRIYKPPAGAVVTPIDQQKLLALMLANSGPQKEQSSAFSPGSPLAPTPGITLPSGPRGWTFPIGYNIGQLPRATEATSFDTLRNLASLYDAVGLCKQSWFDLCSRLEIEIKPIESELAKVKGDVSMFADDIAKYKDFFENPDPEEDLDLPNWMIKALGEQLDLDALAIFVQPNRGGGVYGLNIIDGSTIKPLINDRGRKPAAPYPAFQQFWHGAPLGWYTSDQMIYHRETQRADSVYGLSRVERIILRVNQALRKQNKDLSYYTEGNLPAGILEMPETDTNEWTPDEVLTFQRIWDGLLSGNDKTRSRLKVVPPGAKFTAIENQDDLSTKFDMFLLNTTVATFGLTMAELGFTENVNKSSGDSQEDVTYRRAMRPMMSRYAKLFTAILRKYFKETRFIVTFKGYEEVEDLKTQSDAYGNLVTKGLLTIQDADRLMGLPYEDKTPIPRFVLTPTGPIFFEDLLDPTIRQAQKDAQMAGFQQALQPPEQGNGDAPNAQDTQSPSKTDSGKKQTGTGTSASSADGKDTQKVQDTARSLDYRRWRERALDDVKSPRSFRPFVSDAIPDESRQRILWGLARCINADDVRRVFELERSKNHDDTGSWQLTDNAVLAQISELQLKGVTQIRWLASSAACDECIRNDKVVVAVGEQFPTGALIPVQHKNCMCAFDEIRGE